MPTFKLYKNGELINTIVADRDFINHIANQYDNIIEEMPQNNPLPSLSRYISTINFKLRFTTQERVAIRSLAESDPVVYDFLNMIEDPRLTNVDLNLPDVVEALDYLISKNIINQQRKQEILA